MAKQVQANVVEDGGHCTFPNRSDNHPPWRLRVFVVQNEVTTRTPGHEEKHFCGHQCKRWAVRFIRKTAKTAPASAKPPGVHAGPIEAASGTDSHGVSGRRRHCLRLPIHPTCEGRLRNCCRDFRADLREGASRRSRSASTGFACTPGKMRGNARPPSPADLCAMRWKRPFSRGDAARCRRRGRCPWGVRRF